MNKIKFVCLHNSFNYGDVDVVLVTVNRFYTILIISEGIKFNSFVNTIESNRYSNWKLATFYSVLRPFLILEVLLFITTRFACLKLLWMKWLSWCSIHLCRNCFLKFTKSYFTILWSFMGSEIVVIAERKVVAWYCNLDELENGKSNFQQYWITLHRHKNIS